MSELILTDDQKEILDRPFLFVEPEQYNKSTILHSCRWTTTEGTRVDVRRAVPEVIQNKNKLFSCSEPVYGSSAEGAVRYRTDYIQRFGKDIVLFGYTKWQLEANQISNIKSEFDSHKLPEALLELDDDELDFFKYLDIYRNRYSAIATKKLEDIFDVDQIKNDFVENKFPMIDKPDGLLLLFGTFAIERAFKKRTCNR